jgi:hypothetical protein
MIYRVSYMVNQDRCTAEVEASSPQEAMVKFNHTRAERPQQHRWPHRILSVSPQPQEQLEW